ncbi:crotonase/enoyl-CoA hydratase family protein [Williamsia sp. CHRR-6]|uniref:crotonase/enoyl-CoA hydratase family protein n=1 Tax=Williamsia sp. CHRR-6 TaxID=2835871 RepID=UPI001BDB593F|nr:crotonase/enoyl-CoA hydratase family protein [Williamsia sp. CHRR-6]MBT0566839.1 crotonase/enoyl-CoA hydratase family protein [Williamsia sp. CHRR-6]
MSTTPSSDLILTERRGADESILLITINREQRRNSFDGATAHALEAALDAYEDDSTLRVAVITGAGPTFSAGQDLKAAAVGDYGSTERRGGFGIMAQPPTKPIIAAVEGDALAGGFELCLACDLIVATEATRMGLPEAARGLIAVGGGLFRLPKRIPHNVAVELALTGKPQPASEFHRLGLVSRITPVGGAVDAALELAGDIAAAGPLSVIASKQILAHAHEWTDEQGWAEQMVYAKPVMDSEDLKEGLAAFAQKRAPQWKGR